MIKRMHLRQSIINFMRIKITKWTLFEMSTAPSKIPFQTDKTICEQSSILGLLSQNINRMVKIIKGDPPFCNEMFK